MVPVVLVAPVARTGPLALALLVVLPPDLAVAVDLGLQPLRQGVDDRHADAVQAARDLVGVVVELAAGVRLGQDDLQRALVGRTGGAVPTGMPRPSSTIEAEPSAWTVTWMCLQWPAIASSIELSTTS